jgi:hypothetical protein
MFDPPNISQKYLFNEILPPNTVLHPMVSVSPADAPPVFFSLYVAGVRLLKSEDAHALGCQSRIPASRPIADSVL